jgi:hypothetical protein
VLQRMTLIKTSSISWHVLLPVLQFANSSDNYMLRPLSPGHHPVISYKMYLMMTWWKRRKHVAVWTLYEIKSREKVVWPRKPDSYICKYYLGLKNMTTSTPCTLMVWSYVRCDFVTNCSHWGWKTWRERNTPKEVKGSVKRKLSYHFKIQKLWHYVDACRPTYDTAENYLYKSSCLMVIVDKIIWGSCIFCWLNSRTFRNYVQPPILEWLNTELVQWLPIHMLIKPIAT